MVGGGRRDEGSMVINNTNVFAALETLRKKKKSDKDKSGKSKSKSAAGPAKSKETEPVYWAPAPLTSKSWADVSDGEDDDYYATTVPPPSAWGKAPQSKDQPEHVEEVRYVWIALDVIPLVVFYMG